ncbi:hypothetical protein HYDPIDRAFT_44507 [Hydnomerulius pinastri MD-312]|uniref:Uncharacterized protein n=1 Tax=Hydnomerulius pinastri MD-312 TaxID=994086 RepID=A0A0C9VL78_9AGAM|nr:hypothetical protein HYDPIDRAFT_44507 [Hydnomerulius pinastri MD-312]
MLSQHCTKVPIEDGLKPERIGAAFITNDLADRMSFGSLISTKLASEVLEGLFQFGMVKGEKVVGGKATEVASHSIDAKAAVNEALDYRQRLYRFAVPHDTTRAFPAAYPSEKADMRLDFVILLINTFETSKTRDGLDEYTQALDRKWLNFTAIRLTGECKASDANRAFVRAQRYMRDTNRVQPWQHFVTGLTVMCHKVAFIRAEDSGVEMFFMRLE